MGTSCPLPSSLQRKATPPAIDPRASSLASSRRLAGVGGWKAQRGSFSLGLALAHLLQRLAQKGGHPGLVVPWAPASINSPWDLNFRSPAQSRDLRQEGEATVGRGRRTTSQPSFPEKTTSANFALRTGEGRRAFSRAQPSASFPLCCRAAGAATRASCASRLPLRPELARGEESWKRSARLGCDCHPGAGARESEKERRRGRVGEGGK